jgi:peptidoglycan hydrolase-like protein with peptidoglycan-binding domain
MTSRPVGYAAAGVLAILGVGWLLLHRASPTPATDPADAVATTRIVRTNVAEHSVASGTLGYPDPVALVAAAPGMVTWLPRVGATVGVDQRLYEVDGRPVLLWSGSRPAWRDFAPGMPPGPDVAQLERNLAALGYGRRLTVDGRFSAATAAAVRRWQAAHGVRPTGTVRLGEVIFLPGRVRVDSVPAALGTPAQPGAPILTVTSTAKAVTVNLDPAQQDQVHLRDRVSISLVNGTRRTAGTVAGIGAPTTAPATNPDNPPATTIPVTIALDTPEEGTGPVQVTITTAEHRNVLAVPIDALLAAPGGGYRLAVLDHGRRLVTVQTGLFDESGGVVEVSGAGIAEGTTVEVPAP